MTTQVLHGDSLEVLQGFPDCSFQSLVTDPPAGIKFMGKKWDHHKGGRDKWIAWLENIMVEALRVLVPGAYGVVWAIPRTSHWTATALENAGFEIRDVITHINAQGFPKSVDVTKELLEAGAVHAAEDWIGWGTALKPASEHWILVRKPLIGTIVENILTCGAGAINVGGCAVGDEERVNQAAGNLGGTASLHMGVRGMPQDASAKETVGRWPPNVVFTHDERCNEMASGRVLCHPECPTQELPSREVGGTAVGPRECFPAFVFESKAGRGEKDGGLDEWAVLSGGGATGRKDGSAGTKSPRAGAGRTGGSRNHHPTVKAVDLMRWFVRLVTPSHGRVLDVFCGSGSTGCACAMEDLSFTGVDIDETNVKLARDRIAFWMAQRGLSAEEAKRLDAIGKKRKGEQLKLV